MLPSDGAELNVNDATEKELTQLPRIGADRAKKIVHYRAIRRGFRDWVDLAATVGIPEEDIEAIKTKARIGPYTETAPIGPPPKVTVRGPAPARRSGRPRS